MGLTFTARAQLTQQPFSRTLFLLMARKETNLAFSADVLSMDELLHFADLLGPEICMFKTHIDIVEDFSMSGMKKLQALAKQHEFVIFEDRKFADIGQTVQYQYAKGVHHIAEWADLTNAHILPGEGVIQGLREIGQPRHRGLLLLAEMSSKGHLFTAAYRQQCFALAFKYRDFVSGFICQQGDKKYPEFLYIAPGVKLAAGGDGLGQQYRTPEMAIVEQDCDIIIVGRGISTQENPLNIAQTYRANAWKAYLGKMCN